MEYRLERKVLRDIMVVGLNEHFLAKGLLNLKSHSYVLRYH